MERLLTWIRDNPQFAALTFGAVVLTFVLTVFTVAMLRAGASLRPIIWFLGFFGIVAGPQAVIHLLDGFVLRGAAQDAARTTDGGPRQTDGTAGALAPVPWSDVFGPKADPALITDAKRGLGAILGEALEAKLSFNTDGESALAARFASAPAAARARDAYGNFFAFANAHGSDASGWTARRHAGQGEWVHVVSAGPELYAWTGASEASVLAHRIRALGPMAEMAPARSAAAQGSEPVLVSTRLRARSGLMAGILALNVIAAGLWFFKGSAWAARVEGPAVALPDSGDTLREALLALNRQDVPPEITRHRDGSLEVNWRYLDARWFDLMRVHQMKRTHRLVLAFDDAHRTVRVTEYWSSFDASAGAGSLRLAWKAAKGIQFFAVEQTRIFGAQLDPAGKPTGELSKAYTFDLQALKKPVIETVTGAGWRWQPVTWDAPASLRWLTE
jgi:hypothetical protein